MSRDDLRKMVSKLKIMTYLEMKQRKITKQQLIEILMTHVLPAFQDTMFEQNAPRKNNFEIIQITKKPM